MEGLEGVSAFAQSSGNLEMLNEKILLERKKQQEKYGSSGERLFEKLVGGAGGTRVEK